MIRKKTVIHAELRKESETFEGWLKYEITLKHPNGNLEKIPAYGKDLQDALNRVVHDEIARKYSFVLEKIPSWLWAALWIGVMTLITLYVTKHTEMLGETIGLIYLAAVSVLVTTTITINNFFKLRNKDKK